MKSQQAILNEVLNSNSVKRNSLIQKVLELPFTPIETIEERQKNLNSDLNNYGEIIKTKLKQEIDIMSKKNKASNINTDNKTAKLNDKVNNKEEYISSDKKRNSMTVMSDNLKILDSLNNLKKKIHKNDFFSYDNNKIVTKESSKNKDNAIKSINNKLQSKFINYNNDDKIETETKSNNEFTPVSCFKKTKTNKNLVIKEEFLLNNNNTDKKSVTPKIKKSTCSLVLDIQQDDIKFSYVNYSSKKQITCKDILDCLESKELPHKRRSQTVNKIIILNDSKDSCDDSSMDFERVISKLYVSKKNNNTSKNKINNDILELNVDSNRKIMNNNNNNSDKMIENSIKKVNGHYSTADFKITEVNQLNSQTSQINRINKNLKQKTLYLKNEDEEINNNNNSKKDSYSFNDKKEFESSSKLVKKDIVYSSFKVDKNSSNIDQKLEENKDKEINENKSKFKTNTNDEKQEFQIPLSTNFETLPNEQNNDIDKKKITKTAKHLQKNQDSRMKIGNKDINNNKNKIIVNSKSINEPYIYSHRNSESGSIDINYINNNNNDNKDVIYLDTHKNNINIFNNIKNNIHHSSRPSEKNVNKQKHKSCHCGCVVF